MYAEAIKRKQAKLKPTKNKNESSESTGKMSVDIVERIHPTKKRQVKFDFLDKKNKKIKTKQKDARRKGLLKKGNG